MGRGWLLGLIGCTMSCGLVLADDWPMLGHDAARSGTTSNSIQAPFARKWYRLFPEEGIQAGVQPIVANGHVYLGTLKGTLHAIEAQTGKDTWIYRGEGPVLHSAAAGTGRVFVAIGRALHAINPANGAKVWSVETPQTIWNAPVVHNEMVIFGGRDDVLRALAAKDGAVKWTARTGGPILNSPAIDAQRGRVYVGAEDMKVYGFELASGKPVWVSPKVPGVSFRGYHPVIAPDGSVMVTVTPCAGGDALQQVLLEMVKEVFGEFSSWRIKSEEEKKRIRAENFELMTKPETYTKQMDYLRQRLTDEPAMQTFFVLDPASGKPKFVTPIVYAESMNGPGNPALVTPEGKVIVKYNALLRSRYEHYSPFLNVGYLDTKTGNITPVMDQSRTYGWHDSLLLVHDEQSQIVAAGKTLINTHQDNVNAMDLVSLKGEEQPWAQNVHEAKPGTAAAIWATLFHAHKSPYPHAAIPVGWEWLARGTAVYGGGSAIDVPIVVAGNSFYFLPTHELNSGTALIAYTMDKTGHKKGPDPAEKLTDADWPTIKAANWDWDMLDMHRLNVTLNGIPQKLLGTRASPRTDYAVAQVSLITDDKLDELIFKLESPGKAADALRAQLKDKVNELIAEPLRPLLFPAAKAPSEAYRLYDDPAELLYTLALAYPQVDEPTRQAMAKFVAQLDLSKRADARVGAVRSAYDEAPATLLHIAKSTAWGETGQLYPMWLWAQATGNWQMVERQWLTVRKTILAKPPRNDADLGNANLAGLIAGCRMARQMKDEVVLTPLLANTRQAIRQRLEYELAHNEGGVLTLHGTRTLLGRWHHLTPEVAAILRQFCKPIHQRLMDVYVDHHRPAWYVAWNVELLWRNESPFSFPDMSVDILSARAMILEEKASSLQRYLDIPWCRGDLTYVRKLAMLTR